MGKKVNKGLENALNNHHSTCVMYSKDTFGESLQGFQQNIRKNFDDLEKI